MGIAAEHGRIALASVLAVSLLTVADSFRTLVRRYRHGSSFPLGPSLLVAAGSTNVIMTCRWLLSLPVFP